MVAFGILVVVRPNIFFSTSIILSNIPFLSFLFFLSASFLAAWNLMVIAFLHWIFVSLCLFLSRALVPLGLPTFRSLIWSCNAIPVVYSCAGGASCCVRWLVDSRSDTTVGMAPISLGMEPRNSLSLSTSRLFFLNQTNDVFKISRVNQGISSLKSTIICGT